jgi:iron complex outermembrane receptor protein
MNCKKKSSSFLIKKMPYLFAAIAVISISGKCYADNSVNLGEAKIAASGKLYKIEKEKKRLKKTDGKFTKKKIFKSTVTKYVENKDEIQAAGPVGGATQALSMIPGVRSQTLFGPTGASKGQFAINGIQQGYGGLNGETDNGSIAVTFDGVPMNNPGSGLWSTALMPDMSLIQGINVIYGPGNPASRWYNSLGGTLNFVPIQPTVKPGGYVSLTIGSFDTKNINFNVRSGMIKGYSLVIAGGTTTSNDYITGSGFYNPTYDYALYGKLVKTFYRGNIALGAYITHADIYRPPVIPLNPIEPGKGMTGVTVNGWNASGNEIPGEYYSQATSGFYSTLPQDVYSKLEHNYMYLIYSPLNIKISKNVGLHNLTWYRQGNRLHIINISGGLGNDGEPNGGAFEYNNPQENMYGDKMYLSLNLPYNFVKVGGYWLNSDYVSRNQWFNPTGAYCSEANGTNEVTSLSNPCAYRYSNFQQTFQAAFIQDRISPIKNLRITPGLRFVSFYTEYNNEDAQYYPYTMQINPGGELNNPTPSSTTFEKLEPSIGANYKITKNLAVYANYATAYQNPHLGGGGGPMQSPKQPASILQPEKNVYESVGFKVLIHRYGFLNNFVLNANYYHESFSNEYLNVTLADGTVINSSGNSNYEGFNLYAEDNPVNNLHVFTNFSYEKAHYGNYLVNNTTNYTGLNVPYVPEYTFNAGAYYKIHNNGLVYSPKIWDSYTGKQYMINDVTGAPSHQTMPSYNILNASFSVNVPFVRKFVGVVKNAKLTLSVLNLLNKQYNGYEYISAGTYFGTTNSIGQILAYPGMPISTYLTLNLKF